MTVNQEPEPCAMCKQTGTLKCTSCNSMHYCSKCQFHVLHCGAEPIRSFSTKACQKIDWPLHKLVCKTFKIHMITKPSSEHHSVIYFSPDETLPRFMWMNWGNGLDRPGYKELAPLGIDAARVRGPEAKEVNYNEVLDRHIDPQHLGMILPKREDFARDDLPPNQSLIEIDEELASWLRGPVLVRGVRCNEDICKTASLDMGPADFRHAIDDLRWSYEAHVQETEALAQSRSPCCLMRAVRLNCLGDKIVGRRPSYESVIEDAAFVQVESDVLTPMATHFGIPLVIRKVAPALFWRDHHLEKRKINYYVDTLNTPQEDLNIGSVVVARKDGIPLLPTHVLALSCYAIEYLKDPGLHPNACVTASMLKYAASQSSLSANIPRLLCWRVDDDAHLREGCAVTLDHY